MKCKDIAHKHKVTAMQVGRLRKKLFPNSIGGDLTPMEEEVINEYYEELNSPDNRKEIENALEPTIVEGFCTYYQSGRREIECKVRGEKGFVPVRVLIPNGVDPASFLQKKIKLERIVKDGTEYYRHASLANYAWPRGHGGE